MKKMTLEVEEFCSPLQICTTLALIKHLADNGERIVVVWQIIILMYKRGNFLSEGAEVGTFQFSKEVFVLQKKSGTVLKRRGCECFLFFHASHILYHEYFIVFFLSYLI